MNEKAHYENLEDRTNHTRNINQRRMGDCSFSNTKYRAVRRPRRVATTNNLWAPQPPTFVDWSVAADCLSARRRCHFCCVLILLQFSMTKKCHQEILRIERNFSGIFEKKLFGRQGRRCFGTVGAPSPPTKIGRRTAADTMTSAHGSTTKRSVIS